MYKKKVNDLLKEVYPEQAGNFTQALMELGATLCGPNSAPVCDQCPCSNICMGYRNGTAATLPVKQPKKKRRVEEKTVLILSCDGKYALVKRPDRGLLASMWQFPDVPGKLSLKDAIGEVEQFGLKVRDISREVERNHIFTHVEWQMRGYYMEVSCINESFIWYTPEQINAAAALPTAYRQFWNEISEMQI